MPSNGICLNMAESGGQEFSEMEEIDVNQILLIQSWVRGALVRKWMRKVQNCYQQVVTDIEKDSSVWVDWQTEGLCRPKVTRRKRPKLPEQGTKTGGNPRDQSHTLHPNKHVSDQVNPRTTKLISNEMQIQASVNEKHQRLSNDIVLPTEYLLEETGFNSVETQTSLIEIHSNKFSKEEENEKVLAGIDTSWLDRVKASKEQSGGEEDLHLDLDSERDSLRSRYSDTSENLSQKDKGFSDRRERDTEENHVQDIELIDSFSDRSYRSGGSSTSLKERVSRSRLKPVEQKDSENDPSPRSDRPEESQRSYRSNRSDKSDGMRREQSDKHKRSEDSSEKGERLLHSDRSEKSQRTQRSDTSAKSRSEKHKRMEIDDEGQSSQRSNRSESRKSDRSDKPRGSRADTKQMSDEEEGQRSHRSHKSDDVKSQKSDRSQRSARSNKSSGRMTPECSSDRESVHVKPRSSARSPVPSNHHPGKETVKGDKSYMDQEPRTVNDSTTLTNVTSVWDSFNSVLESHEFKPSQPLPQDPEKLRELRKNVAMELLWVQQAIQSRKNMMRRHDSEVISTTSSTSKGSERRKNRFSLRRIFYPGRTGRTKSRISLNSTSSAHSDYSSVVWGEREHGDARSLGAMAASGASGGSMTSEASPSLSVPASSTLLPKAKGSEKARECPLCLMEHPVENFPEISTCYHRSCLSCLRMYLRIEITESRVNIACPECAEKFHPNDIKDIIQDEALMSKYEEYMVRRVLVADPDARWCPAPDCGYAVIATECAGCPKIKCERPGCDTFFCYHCKQMWHPNKTCDTARAERQMDARNGSISYSHDTDSQKDYIKPCPRCSAFIMKMNDGSCNHMTCPVCGAEFCWLCMKEISDLHYLSPSGCTFWGKKPWSRKKKILWQLGTLVGAPVGITLLAGIAVPAMIIGIPVWVGRKIHSKYEMSTRHRRNAAIAGGVAASILMSPVIAGLAVGIGVPILLGYVYGVVPISLCRSGGCGVRTTNSGGVRFEFEENETGIPSAMYSGVDSQSVGTGHQVPNPSIAPSIGEASVAMTNSIYSASSSHMDRVGINREESDRDSASNRAIAGASLNGSMCGSTYAAVISLQTKLEVQAELESDVTTGKRASFSSESANFSIGEKSIGEKSVTGDDASTRGLAGSIANYKMDCGSMNTSPDNYLDVNKIPQQSCKYGETESVQSRDNGHLTPQDGEVSSLSSRLSTDDKKRTNSCPGSPLSGCGSCCEQDEASKTHSFRCRKCRRHAKASEKHATEQMNVHFSDQVSLQSFQADEAVLDLPMGKHDIDSLSEMCNEDEWESSDSDRPSRRPPKVRNNSEPAILLTEVESDRPSYVISEVKEAVCDKAGSLNNSQIRNYISSEDSSVGPLLNSFSSSLSMKFSKTNMEEKSLPKCRSEEIFKKDKNSVAEEFSEKSKSEEIFNKTRSNEAIGGCIKRVRRKSCELAIQNGRISPLTAIQDGDKDEEDDHANCD